ncbi:MAG TPA: hypothetical protein VGL78_10400 [Solirubrobacteraceae bacterium]
MSAVADDELAGDLCIGGGEEDEHPTFAGGQCLELAVVEYIGWYNAAR